MSTNGINRLIAVTQMKSSQANEEAMQGADKQRKLLDKQRTMRDLQRCLETALSDSAINGKEIHAIWSHQNAAKQAGMDTGSFGKLWTTKGSGVYVIGEETDHQRENKAKADALKSSIEGHLKELDSQDRLGNLEINQLMSAFNQSETLAASVLKIKHDAGSGVIGKM
jgi:uncharacterized protein YjiS (DUF1127 family)